jgi:hypothetical protein
MIVGEGWVAWADPEPNVNFSSVRRPASRAARVLSLKIWGEIGFSNR